MSFERKRRISIGLTSAYFLTTAAFTGLVVLIHASISCCGIVLFALASVALLYGTLAQHGMKDFRRAPDYIDPADFGMSIGTANFIRTLGLLVPLPLLAYSLFFLSGLSWVALDGSPESVARTYAVINLDHKVFGHRMAQREYRRAARIYAFKRNYRLAQMFIRGGISCAEEHTAHKPSRSRDLHFEAGRIASRAGDWIKAEKEYTTALNIAKNECGCDENSRIVRILESKLSRLHANHLTNSPIHNGSITYEIDPQVIRILKVRAVEKQ